MSIDIHEKYPLFLSEFNERWIFSTDFWNNTQISNFIKICPVGAELFHADGGQAGIRTDRRPDMTTLIVAFRSFANALKNLSSCHILEPYTQRNTTHYTNQLLAGDQADGALS
jgi:hypothetical protein